MKEQQITEHEFENLVELAINSDAKYVLHQIRKDLEHRLDLDKQEFFADSPESISQFEGFIKQVIDEHGANFTGNEAINIAKKWISNSRKVSVPEYQQKSSDSQKQDETDFEGFGF